MKIPDIDVETQDLDWFAIDKEGAVGHFTTGGFGVLPRPAASSYGDLKKLLGFFRETLAPATTASISNNLQSHKQFNNDSAKSRYLHDSIAMASRGLFSFDCCYGNRPTGYFKVTLPSKPLHFSSLPVEIQQILKRTVLSEISFKDVDEINEEYLLSIPEIPRSGGGGGY
jgi:hypothetical protein